jgi:hypothetical protein
MAATISPKQDETVAAAPPESAVPVAGSTSPSPAAPARSRGVRRLVVFVGKPRRGVVK